MTDSRRNLPDGHLIVSAPRRAIELDVVETLLEFKERYLDSADPAEWQAGQLAALLTEIVPRKVFADQDWSRSVVETVPAFVEFLGDEKHVRGAQRLRSEADAALPVFLAAVDDPDHWGMGKRLPSGMGGIADPGDLDDLVSRFNELPRDERDRILGGTTAPAEPPAPLPAVRLAPLAELVAAARESALIADIVSLVRWLGERREITDTGVLRVKVGKQAALALGLVDPQELASRELLRDIRSSAELAALDELWRWSVSSGFITLIGTRAYPGPVMADWQSGGDEAVLTAWGDTFDAVLAGLVEGDAATFSYQAEVHVAAGVRPRDRGG